MIKFLRKLFAPPVPEPAAEPPVSLNRYGWKKDDADPRDHVFALLSAALPPKADLRGGMPAVYDQGNLGSCSANAIAAAIEFARIKQGLPDYTPSRLFIYWYERYMENTVSQDAGAMLRDGFKVINKQGAPRESHWLYLPSRFTQKPSLLVALEARMHPSVAYAAVAQNEVAIKSALAGGYPVSFGFIVYMGFESAEVARTGVVAMPLPGEQKVGGHAVLICGFNDQTQMFVCRNSWGAGWGDAGYFYMPYAYVLDPNLGFDFWVLTAVK